MVLEQQTLKPGSDQISFTFWNQESGNNRKLPDGELGQGSQLEGSKESRADESFNTQRLGDRETQSWQD